MSDEIDYSAGSEGLDEELNRLTRAVIGCAIAVHRELGPGYIESVYENALAIEMLERGLNFSRQNGFGLWFKEHSVGLGRIDFLVADKVIVELKAINGIAPIHRAQILSHLLATGYRPASLINFNEQILKDEIGRYIF